MTKSGSNNKMTMMLVVMAVVVVAVIAAYFLLANRGVEAPVMTDENMQEETMMEVTPGESMDGTDSAMMEDEQGVVTLTVDGAEYSFSPSTLSVNKGDTVKVVFNNVGTMPHDFIIDEFDVATKTIAPGEQDTVEFTANQSGTFSYYCSVGNHRALGMEGTLTVE